MTFSHGCDLGEKLVKALSLGRNIFGITIEVDCNSVAKATVTFPLTDEDADAIIRVVETYEIPTKIELPITL